MVHKTKKNKAKKKQQHSTICVGQHYAQSNTNNVNKTCAHLQTTAGKDKANIGNRNGHHRT